MEAERDVLAAAAGVTPERCRAAKAQLFEAAKLCGPPEALPGYSVESSLAAKVQKLCLLQSCGAWKAVRRPKLECSAATMR